MCSSESLFRSQFRATLQDRSLRSVRIRPIRVGRLLLIFRFRHGTFMNLFYDVRLPFSGYSAPGRPKISIAEEDNYAFEESIQASQIHQSIHLCQIRDNETRHSASVWRTAGDSRPARVPGSPSIGHAGLQDSRRNTQPSSTPLRSTERPARAHDEFSRRAGKRRQRNADQA